MLFPAESIKPFILHESKALRQEAHGYFTEAGARDPDIMGLTIKACQTYGARECSLLLARAVDLEQTEDTLRAVLEILASSDDRRVRMHCNRILAASGPAPVLVLAEKIGTGVNVDPGTRARLRRRLELVEWGADRLWDRLHNISTDHYAQHLDAKAESEAEDIIDELARGKHFSGAEIASRLKDKLYKNTWMECFLVELAGKVRAPEAIPAIVEKLRIDSDVLLDTCIEALPRIGGPGVPQAIRRRWHGSRDYTKLYMAGALEHTPCPESEALILDLLGKEQTTERRTDLAEALCHLFSNRIEAVLEVIREGYDDEMVHLPDELVWSCRIMGKTFPEMAEWGRVTDQREALFELEMLKIEDSDDAEGGDFAVKLRELLGEDDVEDDEGTGLASSERAGTAAQIGRNASCPCGSGRKYKRCCGRDAGR